MDRITLLVKFQWRAYWRRFKTTGYLTRNNVGILVLLGGLGVSRYFQQLPFVAEQLARQVTTRYETLLVMVFLACLLAVMAETRRSISARDLLSFPLSALEHYGFRFASVFISPVSWAIIAGGLALTYPISKSAHPLTGTIALVLYLLLALLTALTVTDVLSSRTGRRIVIALTMVLSAAFGVSRVLGPTFLDSVSRWLPAYLTASVVVSSSGWQLVVSLAFMTIVMFCCSWFAFRMALFAQQHRRMQRAPWLPSVDVPGKFVGLLRKDCRYSFRLLDLYLALPVLIFFNIYLASNTTSSSLAFWIFVNLLLLPCLSLAFNSFGLENSFGLDRYALLPLSGRETLLSKNLSFALVVLSLFALTLPVAIWRVGAASTASGLLILILITLAYLSYGNWLTVYQPFKIPFYRFASGGSPFDALLGIVVGSLPGIIAVYFLRDENLFGVLKVGVMLALLLFIYLFSLKWSARALERRWDSIRVALG